MAKNHIKVSANVRDTEPPTIAGVKDHPGWNALRTIAARITTPLLPDDYLQLANPLWSARELRGRVVEVRRETVDSATLVIKPGWGFSFDYRPGQYIGIGLLVDGRWRWRSYSLTSSPVKSDRVITITVKAMPEGFLSTHLVGGVAPGTIVRLAAPQGNFVMPDPAPAVGAVRHRWLGDHAGDVDAAHAGPPKTDHRCRASAFRADRGRRDVRCGAGRAGADSAGLPVTAAFDPHAGPPRSVAAGRRGARLAGAADLGLRARGHAQRRRAGMVGRGRLPSGCTWSDSPCPAPRRTDRAARWHSPRAARPPWRTPRRR